MYSNKLRPDWASEREAERERELVWNDTKCQPYPGNNGKVRRRKECIKFQEHLVIRLYPGHLYPHAPLTPTPTHPHTHLPRPRPCSGLSASRPATPNPREAPSHPWRASCLPSTTPGTNQIRPQHEHYFWTLSCWMNIFATFQSQFLFALQAFVGFSLTLSDQTC